jgi:hypothetical protein
MCNTCSTSKEMRRYSLLSKFLEASAKTVDRPVTSQKTIAQINTVLWISWISDIYGTVLNRTSVNQTGGSVRAVPEIYLTVRFG